MTPRSLVGMTMGARKRRTRAVTYVVLNEVTFIETAEALADPIHCARFHARKFPRHGYDLQMYTFVRRGYRIGQRLRPCPGCAKCIPGLLAGAWEYCDGSGVLPAKGKVRR